MAQTPFTEARHAGGFLVSEANGHRSRERGLITGGAKLPAGSVLGLVGHGAATAAAAAGNTGNYTCSAVTVAAGAQTGVYKAIFLSATKFELFDPLGENLGKGTVGTAWTIQIGFTFTAGGTAAVAGDETDFTVASATAKYKQYNPANTDGSEVVAGVLFDTADATSADVHQTVVVRACEVNASELQWFSGASGGQITTGQAGLTKIGIISR